MKKVLLNIFKCINNAIFITLIVVHILVAIFLLDLYVEESKKNKEIDLSCRIAAKVIEWDEDERYIIFTGVKWNTADTLSWIIDMQSEISIESSDSTLVPTLQSKNK